MITALRFGAGTAAFAMVWIALASRSGLFLPTNNIRLIEFHQNSFFIKKLKASAWIFFFLFLLAAYFTFPKLKASVATLPVEINKNLQGYEKKSTPEAIFGFYLLDAPSQESGEWSKQVLCPVGTHYIFGSRRAMRAKLIVRGRVVSTINIPETPEAYDYARAEYVPKRSGADLVVRKYPWAFAEVRQEDIILQFQSTSNESVEVGLFLSILDS